MVGGLGGMGGWFLRKSNPNDKEYPIAKDLAVNKKSPLQVQGSGCPMEGDKLHQQPL